MNALSGTGVARVVLAAALPPPPAVEVPVLAETLREVPARDVVALEEMLLVALVVDNVVALLLAVAEGESADVALALAAPNVVLLLTGVSADVKEADDETPAVVDAVSKAFPGEAVAPAPAPDDEPAVLDVAVADELLVKED